MSSKPTSPASPPTTSSPRCARSGSTTAAASPSRPSTPCCPTPRTAQSIRCLASPATPSCGAHCCAAPARNPRLNATFLAFLVLACLLAAVGIITDSAITLVGAMVVGPEFGPLAAIAVGLATRRPDLARRGALALLIGLPAAMLLTAGAALLAQATGLLAGDALATAQHNAFVYEIGPWSLIVALLAGAAGMIAMTSTKSAALIGVFISVTTVPAAGYAALAAALGDWDRCLSSLTQLALNLLGITLAATLTLLIRTRHRHHRHAQRPLPLG